MFTDANPRAYDVGELFLAEAISTREAEMVITVLEHWIQVNAVRSDVYLANGLLNKMW